MNDRITALEEALRPFADFADARGFDRLPDHLPMTQGSRFARRQVTAADFKAARAALAASRSAPDCQQQDLVTADRVRIKPLDVSYILRHAFLAGFVAARNIPGWEECNGVEQWLEFDPTSNPAYHRILAALDLTPAPAVEPVAWSCEEKRIMDDGWTARLVFDHPEAGPRYRNVIPLYAYPPTPTAQDAAQVPEIAALIRAAEETLDEYRGRINGPIIYGMKKINAAIRAIGGDA